MTGFTLKVRLAGIIIPLFAILSLMPAWGQQVKFPRAKSPLLLFGFEGNDGASAWKGPKCELTTNHLSEGAQAVTFDMPKYEPYDRVWSGVTIDWDNGNGYPTNDWSHYGKIAFDAWVEGDAAAGIILECRNQPGKAVWGIDITITPGKKNEIQIPVADILGSDTSNIRQIVLLPNYSPISRRITIDNFRLLPGERLPIADLHVVYPNYRGMIFPGAKDIRISGALQREEEDPQPSELALNLTAISGKARVSKKWTFRSDEISASLPARFSAGTVNLTADIVRVRTGEKLLTRTWALRKLTSAEARSLPVYIDENNNAVVDGKPFFPLGFFNSMNEQYLDEIADSPFNCVLDYGMNLKSREYMLGYLDKARQKGLKVIYCMNDVYPTSKEFDNKSWEGIKGNNEIVDAIVSSYRNHPAILAWYLNDELPRSMATSLEDYYQRVRNADPNHPCYIVLSATTDFKYFPGTTDVMGFDSYPVPRYPVTRVAGQTDVAQSAVSYEKPVWVVPQSFAWYQHFSPNTDRAHIPTAEDLRIGRAPSYEESRCMTYLTLTHGAKGVIYWCYYNMRVLPQYEEMWGWMKKIGSEVKTLSPMLLSPDDYGTVSYSPSSANIHTKLKRYNGEIYLMAVNPDDNLCTVTFDAGRRVYGKAQVMFEGRTLNLDGSKLTDTFKPFEVHVYNLGKTPR